MPTKIEKQALKVLKLVSENEQRKNRFLPQQTKKLLTAIQYLKAVTK